MSRRAEFLARHHRSPDEAEEREIAAAERADAINATAERREADLKRAYLTVPGSTEATWTTERDAILAKDRAEQTIKNREAATASQRQLYDGF